MVMISDYMNDVEYKNPFSYLKPWELNPYEKANGKNIYKNASGRYYVQKQINNERINFGSFDNFQDAMKRRDECIRNGWKREKNTKQKVKEYYLHICLNHNSYYIFKGNKYMGSCATIEEALYFRDKCVMGNWNIKKPYELDLITDNPYLKNGLLYPLPPRLKLPEKKPKFLGCINQKDGHQFYTVTKGKEYFGGYRTYEMAYYVRKRLNECDWDKTQLDKIVEDYPVWYTELMYFYQYIFRKGKGWCINITPKNSESGKLEHLYFRRIEDALWERDLLVKYDWNEELVVECADDTKNPYYDMELPPYPQRKIKNIQERVDRTEMFNRMQMMILCGATQEDIAEELGMTSMTLRNILKREFGISFIDFRRIVESGEDPNEVLTQKKKIYTPDLTRHFHHTNYVSYYEGHKSPYIIYHKNSDDVSEYFGAYPTRELANKISNDLQACNWDKSKLKEIQSKHGWQSMVMSKRWVNPHYYTSKKTGETYIQHYQVRKKDKGSFGTYKDKRVAELVRDLLVECEWDKDKYPMIREFAEYTIKLIDNCWRCNL